MHDVIAIGGFIGGWLLVAGPVWQAAVELREEEFDRHAINTVSFLNKANGRVVVALGGFLLATKES